MEKKKTKFTYCHFCEARALKDGEFIPPFWDVFKVGEIEFIACGRCIPTVRHSLERLSKTKMNELQIRAAAGLVMKLSLIEEEEIATPAEIVDALCPLLWSEEEAWKIKEEILF